MPFETVGAKYRDQYENVAYITGSGILPKEATFSGVDAVTTFPYISPVVMTETEAQEIMNASGKILTSSGTRGYTIVKLDSMTASGSEKIYDYSFLFVAEQPSQWTPAKTEDGRILNDAYLNSASVAFSQLGSPQVQLNFNPEGAEIFAELTKRLIGQSIAIFVG